MLRQVGLTLIELIVVIVIIGILATIGISQYIPARERAMAREAIGNLKLISAAEKVYKMETGRYYNNTTVGNINNELKLSLSEKYWDYNITSTATTFNATADRIGSGGYLNCKYSINQTQTDPVVSATPCME